MIIDGRKIADEIAQGLDGKGLALLVLQVGDDNSSTSYIRIKQKFGQRIGVRIILEQFPGTASSAELLARIKKANADPNITGIIVQLPLPAHIDVAPLLASIDPAKAPDALSLSPLVLPPVVSAVKEIVDRYNLDLSNLDVALVGYGHLVGQPVAKWLRERGVDFALITEENKNADKILANADVIISGVGKPGLIKPEIIKGGVVVIDAGTSEQSGAVRGDCDAACAQKATLFTPVPGGLGPMTVAMLFRNLVELAGRRS